MPLPVEAVEDAAWRRHGGVAGVVYADLASGTMMVWLASTGAGCANGAMEAWLVAPGHLACDAGTAEAAVVMMGKGRGAAVLEAPVFGPWQRWRVLDPECVGGSSAGLWWLLCVWWWLADLALGALELQRPWEGGVFLAKVSLGLIAGRQQ